MGFWYRFSATVSLFGMQIIRFIFETFRIISFVFLFLPMICSQDAYKELNDLYWKELSDYEENEKKDEQE